MAGNYNRIILAGHLARDPELKYTQSGKTVAKFAIAVNNSAQEVLFIDIVAWDKLAENCEKYLRKGSSVLVEGRLSVRSYEDKEGIKRKAVEVVINTMQMMGAKGDAGEDRSYDRSSSRDTRREPDRSSKKSPELFDNDIEDDEIPF